MAENKEQFKNYRVGEIIGRGRFAIVYKAEKLDVRKTVALKVLNSEFASRTDVRNQFREQAKQQAKLTHPRLVRVEDLREEHGQFFVAMEYMPLGSLRSWVTQNGMLSFRQAAVIIADVAEALDYLHGRSLVHGDVKPSNILLMDDPNQKNVLRAKLSDLRLPIAAEVLQTVSENLVELTPEYISPEQASGALITPLSDQYVLGVVAYEMLCGQPPFTNKSQVDLYIDHQRTRPKSLQQLNDQVTAELEQVVLRALEKSPENRYLSCGEFARALRTATAATEQKRLSNLFSSAERLLEKQEFEQTRAALKDTLLIQPENERAVELMARLEQQEGLSKNYKQAVEALRLADAKAHTVRQASPNDPDDAELLKTFAPPPPPFWKQLADRWRSAGQLAGFLLILGAICLASITAWIDTAADKSIQPMIVAINRTSTPTFTPTPTFTLTFTPTLTPTLTPTFTPTSTSTLIGGGSGKIAFVSNNNIYVMNANGSGQINLTKNDIACSSPSWSPDGKKIAFIFSAYSYYSEIYIMNADGSNQTEITKNSSLNLQAIQSLAWSPDGKKIAYSSHSNSGSYDEIFIVNIDGSNPVKLTNNNSSNSFPAWSPDGKKIAFRYGLFTYTDIYVMNADGSNPINLTNNSSNNSSPAWSPDGKKIAFYSYRNGHSEIFVMNADGSNPTNLTNNNAYDFDPAWSPDGKKITFSSDRDGNYEIYIINADGSNLTRLTENDTEHFNPVWSP